MDDERRVHAAAERAVGRVMLCIALASFAVLVFASRKVMALDRAVDIGDVAVLSVFAIFGSFCALIGWRLLRNRPDRHGTGEARSIASSPSEEQGAPTTPPRRVTLSHGCAAAGVVLLMLSVLVPAHWYPVVLFFFGLALLAVSHGLTPCVERIEQLRKARASERQL